MIITRYDIMRYDGGYMEDELNGSYVKFEDHQAEINRLVSNFEEIELWYVKGIGGQYFVDKIEAERVCRGTFGDESPEQRYARIFYRRFYREVV